MKKYFIAVFILLMLSGLSAKANVHKFADGYKIYVNGNGKTDQKTVRNFAAEELQKHLELVFGKKVEIETVKKAPGTAAGKGLNFLIGFKPSDWKDEHNRDKSYYAVRSNNIYFWGYIKVVKDIFYYATKRGPLNALYCFLEDKLGIKWIYPGEKGIAFKKKTFIELADRLDFAWELPYEMCKVRMGIWMHNSVPPLNKFVPEELRLSSEYMDSVGKENLHWSTRMRLGVKIKIPYRHAFTRWWDKYGKIHPEYFGLNPYGKRGLDEKYKKRVKLCLSNPAVVTQIIKDWQETGLKKYINICENDGTMGFCRCKNCMALDTRTENETFYEHLTDRYVYFWNRVAEAAVKLRPDVIISTYVYSYYRHKPRRERIEYPDNLLLGMVPALMEDNNKFFSGWKNAGAKKVFLRPNDLCAGLPLYRGLDKYIYDKFQASKKFDLFGVDYDGRCGVRSIDFEYFTVIKMVTCPEKSFSEIEDEYCSAYGTAAGAVKKFYAFYREKNKTLLAKVRETIKKKKINLLDSSRITAIMSNDIGKYINGQFAEAEKILRSGMSDSLSEAEKMKLDELILHNKHAALTYAFIREANRKKAQEKNELDQTARQLIAFRVKYQKELRWCWPYLFGRDEKGFWAEVPWFRKEVLKIKGDDDKAVVFFSSFDLPSMEKWRARDQFAEITKKTSSFDKYSVKLKVDKNGLGLSRSIPVKAGKKYRISFDSFLEKGAPFVRLRCKAGDKTLFNIYNRDKKEIWVTRSHEFVVPEGIDTLMFYILAGKGEKNNFAYVDKIIFEKVDK